MRRRIFISCIFSFLLLFSTKVLAQAPSPGAGIVISLSEVSGCETSEWIELYNNSDSDVDVSTWKIGKKGVNATTWTTKVLSTSTPATISAKSYKQFSVGSSFFSNEGFSVRLVDGNGNVESNFLEENTFSACPTTSSVVTWIKQGTTWHLTTKATANLANELIALSTPTPSPTPTASPTPTPSPSPTATPTSTPTSQPTGIQLSEIYACAASGEKEWIEIYNSTNNSVTLTGWKITDDDNNEQPISTQTIASKKYVAIEVTKYSRGMLTNDGDVVSLIDGVGKVVEKKEYALCSTETSLAKIGSEWKETTSITKGAANSSQTPSPTPEATESSDFSTESDVLGTQTTEEASIETTPTASPSATGNTASLFPAVAAIGSGTVIMGGVAGYFGYEAYTKKHGKPPFKLPFLKK